MKIAVLGATGSTGSEIVPQAIERGHNVVALARNPSALKYDSKRVTVVKGDVSNKEDVRNTLRDCEAVIVALGVAPTRSPTYVISNGVKNVVECMKELNIKRLLVVSTAGINPKNERFTTFIYKNVVKRFVLAESYADHSRVQKYLEEIGDGIEWTLVQPPYITDEAISRNIATKSDELPDVKHAVVSYADLAYGMLNMLDNNEFIGEKVGIASVDSAFILSPATMFMVIYKRAIEPNKQKISIILFALIMLYFAIRAVTSYILQLTTRCKTFQLGSLGDDMAL